MSKLSKALQAAAGNKPSDDIPEGVAFSTEQTLARYTDFTGNTDSSEFTFSAWVYLADLISFGQVYLYKTNGNLCYFTILNSGGLRVYMRDPSGTQLIDCQSPPDTESKFVRGWNHVMISMDTTNTSNRSIWINNVQVNISVGTYTSGSIDFTSSTGHRILTSSNTQAVRLAHVYLDYTYRNLLNSANRALFITGADYQGVIRPAPDQAALSPIMYFPMTDADSVGVNAGTGGDLSIDGASTESLHTADRGPNQDNTYAIDFNGSTDKLYDINLFGGFTSGKYITVSFISNLTDGLTQGQIFNFNSTSASISGSIECYIDNFGNNGNGVYFQAFKADGTRIFGGYMYKPLSTTDADLDRQNTHVVFSIDMDNQANCKCYIDGVSVTPDISTFVQGESFITSSELYIGLRQSLSSNITKQFEGSIGELYIDESYINLDQSNPFWDTAKNKPVPLARVIENTGTTPLIGALTKPSDIEGNLGSSGLFSTTIVPIGRRGGSEYWAKSVKLSANANRTMSSTTKDFTSTTTFSFSGWVYNDSNAFSIFFSTNGNQDHTWLGVFDQSSVYRLTYRVANSLGYSTIAVNAGSWYHILFTWQFPNNPRAWINGVETSWINQSAPTYTTGINDATGPMIIGGGNVNYRIWNGHLAQPYFTDQFIDFSQRSNRDYFLSVIDQPRNLTSFIENGDIPNPIVYTSFNDPADFGRNDGTGGNFTLNTTIPRGFDVFRPLTP